MKKPSIAKILSSILMLFAVPAMATVVNINSDQSNYTFENGTTYYVSANVTLSATTTFQGGAILKYNSSGQLNIAGTLICPAGPYPAIFTSYNDNTVGETVSGSSGTPAENDVATFMNVTNVTVSYMNFSYASSPFEHYAMVSMQNCEFFNDQDMVVQAWQIFNNLFVSVSNLDWIVTADYSYMQNNTFVNCAWVTPDGGYPDYHVITSDNLFDSSLVADWTYTGTIGGGNAFYNRTDYLGGNIGLPTDIHLGSEPAYQAGPLGDYYLPSDSSLIDAGFMTAVAAELDSFTTQTTETPDSGTVDIGYHYPISTQVPVVLDSNQTNYTFLANVTYFIDANITLYGMTTFESKTVLKFNGDGQINIDSAGTIVCPPSGYPAYPAIFTSYNDNTVGQTITRSSGTPAEGDANTFLNFSGTLSISNMRFCYASSPLGYMDSVSSLANCQFFNDNTMYVQTSEIFNNLFVGMYDLDWFPVQDPITGNGVMQNNTFVNCGEVILDNSGIEMNQVLVSDNLFDSSQVMDWSWSYSDDNASTGANNAFYNCYDYLDNYMGAPTDIGLAYEPAYQTGPLGNYYLPTNSWSLLDDNALVDAGDVSASSLGLDSLTTQTNQMPDSGQVDIGFHYNVLAGFAVSDPIIVATANPLWTDSGIAVTSGEILSITASGTWTGGQGYCTGAGITFDDDGDYFLGGVNHDSLIAYVGTYPPYDDSMGVNQWGNPNSDNYFPRTSGEGYWLVGTNALITVDRSGELWFLINDDAVTEGTDDNAGSLNVIVK